MKLKHVLKISFAGVNSHRSRSALTILGIVIGITAIMLVVSIGSSAESVIVGELGGLGAETVVIRPGKEPKGPTDIAGLLFTETLKERELNAILSPANVPNLKRATPEVFVPGSVGYGRETFTPTMLGIDAQFMTSVFGITVGEGSLFDDQDIGSKSRVAVIGSKVKEELFGQESALGKNIDIKNNKFRVVGIFEEKGRAVFFNVDELVLVPYTSAQAFLTGTKHYNQIITQAKSPSAVAGMVVDIERTLRELHRINDPADDDFNIETQQGIVEQVQTIIGAFTLFLSFVVAISLLVGGIGIMNIMLVSVTERTREIGLRKAIGATRGDILGQFLAEATILTGIGGAIGIILGTSLAFGASFILSDQLGVEWSFSFPFVGALIGFAASAAVGMVFGSYPAYRASKLAPTEALRYE